MGMEREILVVVVVGPDAQGQKVRPSGRLRGAGLLERPLFKGAEYSRVRSPIYCEGP